MGMRTLVLRSLLCLVPFAAAAQGGGGAYAGLAALNTGSPAEAIAQLHPLAESSTDPAVKVQAEYQLGLALAKAQLPVLASVYQAQVVQQGKGQPQRTQAVEALANLQ